MSGEAAPSDNLYMRGLPPNSTEDSIRAIFGVYGTVKSVKVLPNAAGVTDGAALVRMGSLAEAQYLVDNAVHVASGLGSPVQIRFAHSGQNKGSGRGGFSSGGMPAMGGVPRWLELKGLPASMTEDHLRSILSAYAVVNSLKVVPPAGGASDASAIVQVALDSEAQWMVNNLDGNIPQGLPTPISVKFKQEGPSLPPPTAFPVMQDPGRSAPADTVYMKGLPAGSTEQSLLSIFSPYGTVVVIKILPSPPGKYDTAALLRMSSTEEAKWLVDNLDGNIPQGLSEPIQVKFADTRPQAGRGPSAPAPGSMPWSPTGMPGMPSMSGGGGGGHSDGPIPNTNLYMKGLPNETTEMSLKTIFGPYGNVVSVKVLPSNQAGFNNAAALVQMGSIPEAQWLVENVNNNIPEGLSSPIQIKFANSTRGIPKNAPAPSGGGGGWMPQPPGPPMMGVPSLPSFPPANTNWAPPAPATSPPGGLPPPAMGPSDNLYMKGFPADMDEDGLRAILGPYGNIVSVKMLPPPAGKQHAAALVRLSTVAEAKWLVENLHGNIPEGMSQPVEVKYAANAGLPGKGPAPTSPRWTPY